MSRTFGWSYPAGAEHDPRAPWNYRAKRCQGCGEHEDDCECEEPVFLTDAEERDHHDQEECR